VTPPSPAEQEAAARAGFLQARRSARAADWDEAHEATKAMWLERAEVMLRAAAAVRSAWSVEETTMMPVVPARPATVPSRLRGMPDWERGSR
jgi:hypothetical protein